MRLKLLILSFAPLLVAGVMPRASTADMPRNDITRQLLAKEALPNIPGHALTAVTVQLAPGNISPAHKHETFVYVYVLEGRVRSQLGNAKPVEYTAGESWVEPPGIVHTLTQNPSKTKSTKLLAIFVGKDTAKLTTSGQIN